MARKKVKLAYIANDAGRRATFKKRKRGLLKKVSELSTLCNVEACAIVYGQGVPQPEVWPPHLTTARRVLARFRSMPEMEQSKKMLNQESFLRSKIAKLQEQIKKQDRDNRETQLEFLMRQCLAGRSLDELSLEEATGLGRMVEKRRKELQDQFEVRRRNLAAAEGRVRAVVDRVVREKSLAAAVDGPMEALQGQDWYMDLINPREQQLYYGGGEELMSAPEQLFYGGGVELMNPPEQLFYCGGEEMTQAPVLDGSSQWLDPFFPF